MDSHLILTSLSADNIIAILVTSGGAALFLSILFQFKLLLWPINTILGAVAGFAGGIGTAVLFSTTDDDLIVAGMAVGVILQLTIAKLLTRKNRVTPQKEDVSVSHRTSDTSPSPVSNPSPASPDREIGGNHNPGISKTIFLSYRRKDSEEIIGRIYDRLVRDLGENAVFKDVDSIPLGVDFRNHIASQLEQCDYFLSIIGSDWLTVVDDDGNSRLEDPRDHVRLETLAALKKDIPVIPVLVRGAKMPLESSLPDDLKDLSFRNGIAIRPDPDFHRDMDRLISQF